MDTNVQNISSFAQITDVGSVRELNEDSLYCSGNLWLVADGMGGHACGEVASQLASDTIAEEFSRTGKLTEAIELAHHRIMEAGSKGSDQYGMGTTIVAVTSDILDYEVAWVGDSRAYLWDENKRRLSQVSEDHSLVVRLMKSGLISATDALKHPQRHMITQCLGSLEIETVSVDTVKGRWLAGQQLLLCSDGLTDELTDEKIAAVLKQDLDNQEKLATLVDEAKAVGGKDNISIILVDSPIKSEPTVIERLKSGFCALFNRNN